MYFRNWDEFKQAAEELYTSSPDTTRYVHTFRHTDGKLILKVTDDRTVVKFKTTQAADLKKFIDLNGSLMRKMLNVSTENQAIPMEVVEDTTHKSKAQEQVTSSPNPSHSKASSSHAKKKKKNKRA